MNSQIPTAGGLNQKTGPGEVRMAINLFFPATPSVSKTKALLFTPNPEKDCDASVQDPEDLQARAPF